MIDSIHIRLNKSLIKEEQLLKLGQIIQPKKQIEWITSDRRLLVGNYKNFQVTINRDTVCVNGSLPKFVFGHNLFTLSHTQIKQAIKLLSMELGLPLVKGEIARIDIAETIAVDNSIIRYLISMLDTPKYERYRTERRSDSVRYEKGNVDLVFYNKTYEALKFTDAHKHFGSKNVIRIELRIKSNVRRTVMNHISQLYVLHLFSHSFMRRLATFWLNNYNSIIKRRQLLKVPPAKSWNMFDEFLVAATLINDGLSFWNDILQIVAEENNWGARTKRTVRDKIISIYDSNNYSIGNPYVSELNAKITQTTVSEFALGNIQ